MLSQDNDQDDSYLSCRVSTLQKQGKCIQTNRHQQEDGVKVWAVVQGHLLTGGF